ncbi:MAG: hypothetical protein LBP56_05015 [Odoribacteraceae bacterium]|nr:hypothetical protein [Odoribacteraceae bacterium]
MNMRNYKQRETMEEKLKTYSIEKLEKIAFRANQKRDEEMLESALRTRAWKLNETFDWTPGNKEKLLRLDVKLMDCFEKLTAEARIVFEALQQRIHISLNI